MSGKEVSFIFYNTEDNHQALPIFEREVLEGCVAENSVKWRRHLRFDVSLNTKFYCCINSVIILNGRATILNLSEGGLLMDNIEILNRQGS